ncbi:MAG TPA: hypothetical protein VKU92_03970 [Acidimicrobiales bacterium]|nr:hypothetical protein [Acidimicrobiales bacterium]
MGSTFRAVKVFGGSVLLGGMLMLATGVVGASVASASSGCYPPGSSSCKASLTTSSSTVAPGGSFTLNGTGYASGATVTIKVCSIETTSATAGSDGKFALTITIPSTAQAGSCTITATGTGASGSTLTQTTTITITSSGVTVPPAHTGEPFSSWLYWGGAGLAALLGFSLFGLARRRSAVKA